MKTNRYRARRVFLLSAASFLVASSIVALEGPTFNVNIDATNILYTVTPASSNVPGFKPHINFPWLIKRGDGSMVTYWSNGQTHGAGAYGLGAVSNDNGNTWTTPSGTYPYTPPISQMLPPGQFSRGLQINHYPCLLYTSPSPRD